MREPWEVTPGSLVSAVLPPGRRSTTHLGVPYDAMSGTGVATPGPVDRGRGPRRRITRRVRPCRAPRDVTRRPGGRGIVCDPRLLLAGEDRRPAVCRRRRPLDHQRRPRRRVRPAPDLVADLARRCRRSARRCRARRRSRCASWPDVRWRRRSQPLRAKGVTVVTFQPTAADLAVMTGNSMDSGKAAAVCARVRQSVRTHLSEPTVASRLARARRPAERRVERGRLTATTMGGGER